MDELILTTTDKALLRINAQDAPPSVWDAVQPGKGRRLPSIDELECMYHHLHAKGLGNFQGTTYWSVTEFGDTVAWYFDFRNGMAGTGIKRFTCRVRLVVDITTP